MADIKENEPIVEALTTTSAAPLIPEVLDKKLTDIANRETPLRMLLPSMMWSSSAYDFNKLTNYGAAISYAEGDDITDVNSTYARVTVAIKMIGITKGVSGLLQAGSQDFVNAKAQEIQNAVQAVAQKEEALLIAGDSGANPKEFDGLDVQITTNVVDAAAAVLAEDHLFQAEQKIKEAGGKPSLIVMSPKQERALKKLLNSNKVYNDRVEVAGGISVMSYDNMPVVVSTFCPDDTIFVLDTRNVLRVVLKDVTYEDVGNTLKDQTLFRVKEYLALAVRAESHCAKIINLG
jgi:hypothetical protein